MPGEQGKRWCFTINYEGNDGEIRREQGAEQLTRALEHLLDEKEIGYAVVGWETGESGTRHLQGYVEFIKRVRLNKLKHELDPRGHYEIARGTAVRNKEYCTKSSVYREFGTISAETQTPGKRNDLERLKKDLLDENVSLKQISQDHFSNFIRYGKGIHEFLAINSKPREEMTECFIYWGQTGTGKTHTVYEAHKEDLWIAPDNTMRWFNGYFNQKYALFDDVDALPEIGITRLLRLIDRYPMQVPTKGGFTNFKPDRIYFTSNIPWEQWKGWEDVSDEHKEAFKRRLTQVKHFTALRQ